jgi:hypothetical protein
MKSKLFERKNKNSVMLRVTLDDMEEKKLKKFMFDNNIPDKRNGIKQLVRQIR